MIFRHGTTWGLPAFAILLFAFSWPKHALNGDEAWVGEQAYYRATEGVARSPMFRGLVGVEVRTVPQHKLLVEVGALAVMLGGWGLTPLRLCVLVFAVLLLAMYGVYCRRGFPPGMGWLALGLLLSSPLFFRLAGTYRPEILVACFTFGSFVAVEHACARDEWLSACVAGALAGCAAGSHYNGVTVILAGAATFLLMRRARFGVVFVAGALLALAPHLVEIMRNWDLFREQFFNNPMVAGKTTGRWSAWLFSWIHEHKRLFRSPEILLVTVPFCLSLAGLSRERLRKHRVWYIFWFALAACTAVVVRSKLARYALPLFPFFIGEPLRTIGELRAAVFSHRNRIVIALLMAAVGISAAASLSMDIAELARDTADPAATSAQWAKRIPERSTVVAPLGFVFDQIGRYDIIALEHLRFTLNGSSQNQLTPGSFFRLCSALRAQYIIVPRREPMCGLVADSDGRAGFERMDETTGAVVFGPARPSR